MALIIPVGFAQVLIPHTHASLARSALVTFAVDVSSAGGDFDGLADAIGFEWGEAWSTELDNQVTWGPVTLRVGQDGGDPLSVEGSLTGTGTETAASLPPNVALLVRKQTGLGGRRGRGRMYVPWVVQEAAADDVGRIDSASLAVRQTNATNFLEALATGPGSEDPAPMYLLHDSSGAGVEPPPSIVGALVVDSLVATQRRRLGR